MVDAADLKSADRNDHRGSSPLARTSIQSLALYPMHFNALQRAGSVFRILRLGQGMVLPIESANAAPGCGFLSRLQWKGAGTFPQIRRQGVSDQQVLEGAFFIQVGISGDHLATLHHQKRFGSIQDVRVLVGMLVPVMGDRGAAGDEPRHDLYGEQPCPNNSESCGIPPNGIGPIVNRVYSKSARPMSSKCAVVPRGAMGHCENSSPMPLKMPLRRFET